MRRNAAVATLTATGPGRTPARRDELPRRYLAPLGLALLAPAGVTALAVKVGAVAVAAPLAAVAGLATGVTLTLTFRALRTAE
ncbi:MAG: hypothetical protein H7233_04055 [Pseudorhodobacter sp.]|nr:hypothetical protein [Frankiaceae bacterium]